MNRGKNYLLSFDPRLKILLTISFGLLTWKADYWAVLCYLLLILGLTFRLQNFWQSTRTPVFGLGLFLFFWIALKFALEFLNSPDSLFEALLPALDIGTRLLTVLLLGLCLAACTSSRQLGLACNWFLKPFLGTKSWQGALALSLMLHFLPLVLQTVQQAKAAITLRHTNLFFLKKHLVLWKLCLRILSTKTWNQAIALAARGLDNPGAWDQDIKFYPGQWILGAIIVLTGIFINFV